MRAGVWGSSLDCRDPELVVGAVVRQTEAPDRPAVDPGIECPAGLVSLMQRCWADCPVDRPDFLAVRAEIRRSDTDTNTCFYLYCDCVQDLPGWGEHSGQPVVEDGEARGQLGERGGRAHPRLSGREEEVRGLVARAPTQGSHSKIFMDTSRMEDF